MTVRTAYALQFLKGGFNTSAVRSASVPFGSGGEVRLGASAARPRCAPCQPWRSARMTVFLAACA